MAAPTREAALVFADALLEEGDPWGEFIVRSLRGEVEAAASLRRKFEKKWLGGLKPFLAGIEYRDGLMFSAAFSRKAPEDRALFDAACKHPMLGTLRRLIRQKSPQQRINRAPGKAYTAFVTSPVAKALREIDGSDVGVLKEVTIRGGLGITTLLDVRLNLPTLTALAQPGLDRVAALELTMTAHLFPTVLEKICDAPAFKRVPRDVHMYFTTFQSEANDQLAIAAWKKLPLSSVRVWDLKLSRAAEGTTVTWEPTGAGYRLERGDDPFHGKLLAEHVRDLKRVVFSGPPPLDVAVTFARRALPGVAFVNASGAEVEVRKRAVDEKPETIGERVVSFLDRVLGNGTRL